MGKEVLIVWSLVEGLFGKWLWRLKADVDGALQKIVKPIVNTQDEGVSQLDGATKLQNTRGSIISCKTCFEISFFEN